MTYVPKIAFSGTYHHFREATKMTILFAQEIHNQHNTLINKPPLSSHIILLTPAKYYLTTYSTTISLTPIGWWSN